MSISTACIIVRSASESSSIDDSFAIAVGVTTCVLSSGTPRALGLERRASAAASKPPVISTHGKSSVSARRSDRVRASALEAFEVPDLAFAEDEDAAGLEILMEAGERETGLLNVRAGDMAVEPVGAGEQFERKTESLGPAAERERRQ